MLLESLIDSDSEILINEHLYNPKTNSLSKEKISLCLFDKDKPLEPQFYSASLNKDFLVDKSVPVLDQKLLKKSTSSMVLAPSRSMNNRSRPIAIPEVGGIRSIADSNSSSIGDVGQSLPYVSFRIRWSFSKLRLCLTGSLSSSNAFPSSVRPT